MLFVKSFPAVQGDDMALIDGGVQTGARFTSLILAEIAAAASPEQMEGFFLSVGGRLAASYPIGEVRDLETVTQHINLVWHAFNWGQVRFEVDDEGIDIFHADMPGSLEGDAQSLWPKAAPMILVGAYDGWFRQAGSGDRFHTAIRHYGDTLVELRHGI